MESVQTKSHNAGWLSVKARVRQTKLEAERIRKCIKNNVVFTTWHDDVKAQFEKVVEGNFLRIKRWGGGGIYLS